MLNDSDILGTCRAVQTAKNVPAAYFVAFVQQRKNIGLERNSGFINSSRQNTITIISTALPTPSPGGGFVFVFHLIYCLSNLGMSVSCSLRLYY